jgi:putative toxin-antitoxin system antitoxin component (TIGR02293 family)
MSEEITYPILTAVSMLGGSQILQDKPRTALDWVAVIRQGIPAASIDSIAKTIRVTKTELAVALGIPERTLARRKKEGLLTSDESAKLIRLARVVERAEEVFEDMPATIDWLKSPNAALAGETSLSLLDTDIGAESVLDTLGRIAHGVFA